jgi:hypothetical protein
MIRSRERKMNIIKLLILIPFVWVLSVLIAGSYWPVAMILALAAGVFWLGAEGDANRRRAHLQAQAQAEVETARKNAVEAQVKAEQARVRAEQLRIDATRAAQKNYIEGQFN